MEEYLKIKDLCDLVSEYAHEIKGVSRNIKVPVNAWKVAEIAPTKFAILTLPDLEFYICDFVQTRKLDIRAHFPVDIACWRGKLMVQHGCDIMAHDPNGVEPPSVFCHVGPTQVTMVGFPNVIILAQGQCLSVFDVDGKPLYTINHSSIIAGLTKLDDNNLAVHNSYLSQSVYSVEPVLRLLITDCAVSASGDLVVSHTYGLLYVNASHCEHDVHFLPCETHISCALHGGKFAYYSKRQVKVYDMENHHYIELDPPPGSVFRLLELPDGRLAVCCEHEIAVWDWTTRQFTTWPLNASLNKIITVGQKCLIIYNHQNLQIIE